MNYSKKQEQLELLKKVLSTGEEEGNDEELEQDFDDITNGTTKKRKKTNMPFAKRSAGIFIHIINCSVNIYAL